MNKTISLLLVLVTLFSLAACGADVEQPASSTTEQTENSAMTDVTENTQTEEPITGETLHEHTYTAQLTAPTCTEQGYTTYVCNCGEIYMSDRVEATGHFFEQWNVTVEPTVTATGTAERQCSACGTTEKRTLGKVIAGHIHSYTSKVTRAATCTEVGEKVYTCECGESYMETLAKTPHSYTEKIMASTCTTRGKKQNTCTYCGAIHTERLPLAEHSYTAATCTQPQRCTVCSKTTGSFLGHSYDSTHTCTRCGEKDSSQQAGSVSFTANVRSDKGKLIFGVTVKVYLGETLVGTGTTDSKGVAKLNLSASGSKYKVVLSDVPAAYEAKASYEFSATTVNINLTTIPVLDPNDHSQAMYKVGSTMANFVLTDTDGNTYDLSQLCQKKKLIILDFWYVACTWCREEFPIFEETVKEYSDDVIFLAVNPYDSMDKIREAREEDGVTFPMVQDTLNLHKGFDVSAYPTTVFIDSDGKIVSIHSGVFDDKAEFVREIEKYLN